MAVKKKTPAKKTASKAATPKTKTAPKAATPKPETAQSPDRYQLKKGAEHTGRFVLIDTQATNPQAQELKSFSRETEALAERNRLNELDRQKGN